MKKIISVCLIALMILSLAACGSKEKETEAQTEKDPNATIFIESLNDYNDLVKNGDSYQGRTVVVSGWIEELSAVKDDDGNLKGISVRISVDTADSKVAGTKSYCYVVLSNDVIDKIGDFKAGDYIDARGRMYTVYENRPMIVGDENCKITEVKD